PAALASDSGTAAHLLTNNAALNFSTVAADVTRTYTVDGGIPGSSYSAPTGDGPHTVTVTDIDAAGNTASASTTFTLDGTAPTVASIAMSDSSLKIGDTSQVTVTFSEAVSNFDKSDVTAAHGTVGDFATADGGKTWTATFTPDANIENTGNAVTVTAASYTDQSGNAGSGATSAITYNIDTLAPAAPTVSLTHDTTNAALNVSTTAADVTRTYSVDGGVAGSSYSAPTADGSHTVLVTDSDAA